MEYEQMQDLLASILNDDAPKAPKPEAAKAASAPQPATPTPPPVQEQSSDFNFDEIMSQFDAPTRGADVPPPAEMQTVITVEQVEEVAAIMDAEDDPDHDAAAVSLANAVAEGTRTESVQVPETLDDILAAETKPETHEDIIFKDDPAQESKTIPMPEFTSQELADELDIRNFASLVTLNTSRWNGKVKDRKATQHIADAAGADALAFDTHKRLLAGADQKLKAVHKAIDDARTRHYAMTLPWSTVGRSDAAKRTGGRLLPHTMFQEYISAMSKSKTAMEAAADEFEADYINAINRAKANLGTRFDPTEYPNPSSIRQHFGLSFDFNPIPVGEDFRGLADQQVSKLADTLRKKNRVMLENAMQETWTRTYELVEQAADRFCNPEALFHYTLIDKLRDAAQSLQYLNVTKDACIEKVRATIAKHLTMHDADSIRGDEALRKRLGSIAKACLQEMRKHGEGK